jgi:hypothetical protein
MAGGHEKRNWFYTLLVPASVVFAVTAVAVAVLPAIEDRAAAGGAAIPPSAFRTALREDGVWWLLGQVVVVIALSVAAMVWDGLRSDAAARPTTAEPPPGSSVDRPPLA